MPRKLFIAVLATSLLVSGMVPFEAHARTKAAQKVKMNHQKNKMQLSNVSYRKSGGFVATNIGVDLAVSSLSADERATLQRLFDESGLPKLQSRRAPNAADVFYYHIDATTAKGKHYVVDFDDVTLPASLRPLVEFLESKSTKLPWN